MEKILAEIKKKLGEKKEMKFDLREFDLLLFELPGNESKITSLKVEEKTKDAKTLHFFLEEGDSLLCSSLDIWEIEFVPADDDLKKGEVPDHPSPILMISEGGDESYAIFSQKEDEISALILMGLRKVVQFIVSH